MKQTKSKKSMKQFLTLMLAFVMVFTGMGIGSWGVDTAWADNEIPQLTVTGGELKEKMQTPIGSLYIIEVEKGAVESGKNLTSTTSSSELLRR